MLSENQTYLKSKIYLPSKYRVSYKDNKKDTYFKEICAEYSLKRNSFNPNKNNSPPNMFISKLKTRYESYFN